MGNEAPAFGHRDDPKNESMVFENPANGHREVISDVAWLWVVLFGPIYLLVKGLVLHVVVWLAVSFFALGIIGPPGFFVIAIMQIVYAILVESMLRTRYLRKGWVVPGSKPRVSVAKPPDDALPRASSVADELAKLAKLRDDGILTSEEFEHQKSKLLT